MVRGDIDRVKKHKQAAKRNSQLQHSSSKERSVILRGLLHTQPCTCKLSNVAQSVFIKSQVTSSGHNHSRRHRVELQSKSPRSTPGVFGIT